MLAFGPLAYWMGVQSIARAAAPVILDFDSPWARFYFKPVNSKIALIESPEIDHGNRAEILFEHMYRSGMAVSSPAYNWTHYSELVFDAQIVSGKPTELTVHINDHERIGHFVSTDAGTFQVSTNSTEIRISIPDVISATGRDEDLSDIRQIVFLETKRRDGTRLRIDNIHLE